MTPDAGATDGLTGSTASAGDTVSATGSTDGAAASGPSTEGVTATPADMPDISEAAVATIVRSDDSADSSAGDDRSGVVAATGPGAPTDAGSDA
jgi:hypothetical protein